MKAFDSPRCVVLQLVEECNLRCAMCYEWGDTGAYHDNPERAVLDLEVVRRIVEECAPAQPYFELFGGEPLLYPGLGDVIRWIRDAGCELAFPTNGTLLEKHAAQLVAHPPSRIWISLDGPEAVNDLQRGRGVYRRAMRGLDALVRARRDRGTRQPEIGISSVVTPASYARISELFLDALDLGEIDVVSVELQSYATEAQYREYARLLRDEFGVASAPYARAYIRDPALFAVFDREVLAAQIAAIRAACAARGIRFYSQPKITTPDNLDRYLRGEFSTMVDAKQRCAIPWTYAEVSARGEVTTCHTFYDAPAGNVYQQPLLEIWKGPHLARLRSHLRHGLLPICTACCRYYQ